MCRNLIIGVVSLAGSCGVLADEPLAAVSGNASIRAKAGDSGIVITTTDRLAGAIDSLTWGGKEFVDSHDHGRQLQSAASFDCAVADAFWAERFNPTEAGSRGDGTGNKSTSKLLRLRADGPELQTTTRMAFWLPPGEKSFGRPGLNTKALSDHLLAKRVHIGHGKLDHVIEYDVTFTVPAGERHNYGQFEALTGYMPPEFGQFWKFVPATNALEKLSDGPGEQNCPVVLATENGTHAMGIFSPDQPAPGFAKSGYGRFKFKAEQVMKWNCVFRVRNAEGIPTGEHHFRMFVAVGTLEDVRKSLAALVEEFAPR